MNVKCVGKLHIDNSGFTIIELLVTVAILVIMLVIGVPSFANLIDSNRLRTTRDLLTTSINSGLQRASSKNVSVYLCPSSTGTSCDSAWNSQDGWLLYEDTDRNKTLTAGEVFLFQNDIKLDKMLSDSVQITMSSTGHVSPANTFTFCSNIDGQNDQQISINRMGRVTYGAEGVLCP